ncbi:hypothetical protein HDA39_006213 [Kribbella italica]|uniref:Uncharacterized protein n=1 Tax=Kribbella italica TaxID=1540520 RepID=A0A7W9JC78_9ACTN|nr:hypothetical protein [Kribbella italica]
MDNQEMKTKHRVSLLTCLWTDSTWTITETSR